MAMVIDDRATMSATVVGVMGWYFHPDQTTRHARLGMTHGMPHRGVQLDCRIDLGTRPRMQEMTDPGLEKVADGRLVRLRGEMRPPLPSQLAVGGIQRLERRAATTIQQRTAA